MSVNLRQRQSMPVALFPSREQIARRSKVTTFLVTPKVSRAVRQSGAELVRSHSTLTLRGILSADSGWRVPLFSILPKSMRRVNMPANWGKRLDTLLNCMM